MAKPSPAEASIEHQTISRDELRARLGDRSLIILDVLPKEAYAEAHIHVRSGDGAHKDVVEAIVSRLEDYLAKPA